MDERKIHVGNIPRLGGIAIFISFILITILYDILNTNFSILKYWQVLIAFFIIFITGVVDDFKNLNAKLKFALQIIAALFVATSPFYFSNFLDFTLPAILGRVFIFGWILVCVNAYNMIDGMDLICSGICSITIFTFGICGLIESWKLYPILFILFGALLGFMYWNKPNAKIFLGDSGSTTLGFLLAVIPVLDSANATFQFNNLFTSIYIAAIPTIDLVAAIIRRLRDNVGIFSADRAHLHHKLLNIGLTKNRAIFSVLSIQFYISMVLLLPIFINKNYSSVLNFLAYLIVVILFILIHYINLQVNMYNEGIFDNCSYDYSLKRKERSFLNIVKRPKEGEVCTTDFGEKVYGFVKRLLFCFLLIFSWLLSSKISFDDIPFINGYEIVWSIVFFTLLSFSFTLWFSKECWQKKFIRNILLCVIVIGLYCVIDEVHQYFIPNRNLSIIDILFDLVGVLIGTFFGGFFSKYSKYQF